MVNSISAYYQSINFSTGTEKHNADLVVFPQDKSKLQIFEVKSTSRNSEVFKAIGQVLFYKQTFFEKYLINKEKIYLIIVLPSAPSVVFYQVCDQLGICIEVFDRNKYKLN